METTISGHRYMVAPTKCEAYSITAARKVVFKEVRETSSLVCTEAAGLVEVILGANVAVIMRPWRLKVGKMLTEPPFSITTETLARIMFNCLNTKTLGSCDGAQRNISH